MMRGDPAGEVAAPGGWVLRLDYKAYGSQKGWCNSKDAWTVADLYDEALGVEFQIYE